MASTVLSLGYLVPVGKYDLSADDLQNNKQQKEGSYGFMIDAFGPKLFRYGQNREGAAFSQGTWAARVGDSAGSTIVTACVGTTTSMTATSLISLTASQHVGSWLYIRVNNDSAGAIPEGQVSVVVSNTSVRINVDPGRPFTTPLALSDVGELIGNWNLTDATQDIAFTVFGCCVGDNGVADNNFGWFQTWGYDPLCLYSSGTILVGFPIVMSSIQERVRLLTAATEVNSYLGFSPHQRLEITGGSTNPAFIQLDFGMQMHATGATF